MKGFVGLSNRYHFPNKFVAEHTGEWVVAAQHLQIRTANTREPDADEGFARYVLFENITQGKGLILKPEGLHGII